MYAYINHITHEISQTVILIVQSFPVKTSKMRQSLARQSLRQLTFLKFENNLAQSLEIVSILGASIFGVGLFECNFKQFFDQS